MVQMPEISEHARRGPYPLLFWLCTPLAFALGLFIGYVTRPPSTQDWEVVVSDLQQQLSQARASGSAERREASRRDEILRQTTAQLTARLSVADRRIAELKREATGTAQAARKQEVSSPAADPEAWSPRSAQHASFPVIRQNAENRNLTEAQWKMYARSLRGQAAHWRGWVHDVNRTFFGGYELQVDMDKPGSGSGTYEVVFAIPTEDALMYRKEQRVRFEGKISSVSKAILGSCTVHLSDARVFKPKNTTLSR